MSKFKLNLKLNKNNIPNILTMIRIWMAFFLTAFLIFHGYKVFQVGFARIIDYQPWLSWLMFVFFTIAISTDFVDGYLARKWKTVSDFGKLWDPLADKIITIVGLIYLILSGWFNVGLVVLIIIRDLIVDGLRIQMARQQVDIKANQLARIKTFYISILIIVTLLINAIFNSANYDSGILGSLNEVVSAAKRAFSILVLLGLIGAVGISYASGYQYLDKALKLKNKK
ncbi:MULTISPECIES: CDP-diacylglycerol--glycerol-3-phosphate 3-phosphatidyltransferase [unclassified Mycoplasma]|uniref:CDP-diacylglycerol--glycerol-3-phosphate 3-phosphatidyltransferase n=1 Tax=unclassified Mycoplasma TaxID=2683645 RepID=UPI00211C633F|nr:MULTISPECIES: CDP-diacylglycerol--glycerol-3-phosphate 3-phosphatidyltransferase [unclassified Mycoplasma]UUM19702.1 CDP-diacylglycerol--glycerol-3-phosphate 3-phosphatidyltransferase [Mycoplasma sp. 1578d]UUM24685.1 CDP-diacylglycerol--glycerol-3-phosphate 3-phosphatidyltransferase [Mycoplasma sp. 3686d]